MFKYLNSPTGSFCLVTYRPSLLASEAFNAVGAHIFTSTKVEEERYFVTKVLQAHPALGPALRRSMLSNRRGLDCLSGNLPSKPGRYLSQENGSPGMLTTRASTPIHACPRTRRFAF